MDKKPSASNRRVLSMFMLAMINVAAIASIKGLPTMADTGLPLFFFIGVSVLIFFIPAALVSAELATGWPKTGGVYIWVKEALGERLGFLAIWLQWAENLFWFPTMLAVGAACFAYIASPALAQNKFYILLVILAVFWAATFVNFRGMRASGLISTVGVIAGTIIPAAMIIVMGLVWLLSGQPSQIDFSAGNWIPDMGNINNIVLLTGVLLAFMGIEMSAVHAGEVKNPGRDYPKAILLSAVIIIAFFVLGSLAVAIVVPQADISLVAGVMETLTDFLNSYHVGWLIPIMAPLVAVGIIAAVSTWMVGPTKGLFAAARNGDLPPFFRRMNRFGMPTGALIIQGLIVTVFSLVFLLMPTVSSAFWILTVPTAQLYLIMYILMFVSAIRLRYSAPGVSRTYKVPGGNVGMWLVAGVGVLGSLFATVIGFFPPSQFEVGNIMFYEAFLILAILIMCAAPFVIYRLRKPGWVPERANQEEEEDDES